MICPKTQKLFWFFAMFNLTSFLYLDLFWEKLYKIFFWIYAFLLTVSSAVFDYTFPQLPTKKSLFFEEYPFWWQLSSLSSYVFWEAIFFWWNLLSTDFSATSFSYFLSCRSNPKFGQTFFLFFRTIAMASRNPIFLSFIMKAITKDVDCIRWKITREIPAAQWTKTLPFRISTLKLWYLFLLFCCFHRKILQCFPSLCQKVGI